MAVEELKPFDAKRFRDILKQKLGNFAVFDQFVAWKISLDGLQDDVKENRVFTAGVKSDFDNYRSNKVNPALADLNSRVTALEQQPPSPFPG